MSTTIKNDILYSVTAQRGDTLRCKGWNRSRCFACSRTTWSWLRSPSSL